MRLHFVLTERNGAGEIRSGGSTRRWLLDEHEVAEGQQHDGGRARGTLRARQTRLRDHWITNPWRTTPPNPIDRAELAPNQCVSLTIVQAYQELNQAASSQELLSGRFRELMLDRRAFRPSSRGFPAGSDYVIPPPPPEASPWPLRGSPAAFLPITRRAFRRPRAASGSSAIASTCHASVS
jgi:hypothetical protein